MLKKLVVSTLPLVIGFFVGVGDWSARGGHGGGYGGGRYNGGNHGGYNGGGRIDYGRNNHGGYNNHDRRNDYRPHHGGNVSVGPIIIRPGRGHGPVVIGRPGYRHSPYTPRYSYSRYERPSYYYRTIPADRRVIVGNRWFFERAFGALLGIEGYYYYNNYSYFVYSGNMYRYSSADYCNYELVDSEREMTVRSFSGMCNIAYDQCAAQRDYSNEVSYGSPYYCAETYDNF
ncbi:MAG: hypothetical protein U0T83_04320 [Bacteriovoracaceae bacterium]